MYESEFKEILPTGTSRSISKREGTRDTEIDFWEFLLMVGFGDIDATKTLYQNLRNNISPNNWRLALVDIGEAKSFALSGQQLKSLIQLRDKEKAILDKNRYPNTNLYHEIIALYTYTLSTLEDDISTEVSTFLLNESGRRLTLNKNFKLAFDYRVAANQVIHWEYPISHLVESIRILKANGLNVLASIGYRAAGIQYRKIRDYAAAHKYYDIAMNMSTKLKLNHNLNHIIIAKAFAYFSEGNINLAEKMYYRTTIQKSNDPFLPLLNENLALIAKHRDQMELSASLVKDALDISLELDSVSRVPGECEYLGDLYEHHFKDYEQAEYYYKMGYVHSMRYASHGISLTGDRKKAVEAYTNFISRKTESKERNKPRPHKDPFKFASGQSWGKIKDTFQHQLILFHKQGTPNSKRLAHKLGMPATTLYSLQKRLLNRGYSLSGEDQAPQSEEHELHSFLSDHQDLSWTEINQIFEREMMHYLYEKYGYNKHRMANILKISYPSIIAKTRELTQVHDHLLQS